MYIIKQISPILILIFYIFTINLITSIIVDYLNYKDKGYSVIFLVSILIINLCILTSIVF
jgi:hypothetical protein